MIPRSQLEDRGIRDPRVLAAVRAVPRHSFVAPDLRPFAYEDRPLPIGFDVTISQPYIVAAMTELLHPQAWHRVLEIGTGSGYQAAVLSRLCSEVYSVERVPQLAAESADLLRRLGYTNVNVRTGDGFEGWPEEAPFDGIVVTAAPVDLPETLVTQLARGGRLVAPVGAPDRQELIFVEKDRTGSVRRKVVFPVSFVPMLPSSN
jgi:protein-L-isoaspartate(D-aspartate) O-methyltransferase